MPWVFALALLTAMIGCGESGPERAEVRGTVTLDGTPVESGSISFIPIEGTEGPSTGGAITNGAYHLTRSDGPVIGKHRVQILASRPTGRQIEAGEGADDPNAMIDEIEMYIPPEYNTKSKLTADIESGTNQVDFALQSSGT
jgi:hypothetical protein